MCLFGRSKKKPKPPVTPPVPTPTAKPLVGVYVFQGWRKDRVEFNNNDGGVAGTLCPSRFPWDVLATPDRHMALGQYDEADPAITQKRLEWWEQGGIDYAVYQITHLHNMTAPEKLAPWTRRFPAMINDYGPRNHPADARVKFCLDWWDVMTNSPDTAIYWKEMIDRGWTSLDVIESFRVYARNVAEFMRKESYLTVDGRPVLFHANAQDMEFYQRMFGIHPADLIALIRHEIREAIGKEIYLVAVSVAPEYRRNVKALGFDCITEYLLHGSGGWSSHAQTYRNYWNDDLKLAEETGLDVWIAASAGYDARAWGSPEKEIAIPTAREFLSHLIEAFRIALDHARLTRRFVIIYAWNEIGEGGIVEPMALRQLHNGDEMLRAVKAATLAIAA